LWWEIEKWKAKQSPSGPKRKEIWELKLGKNWWNFSQNLFKRKCVNII
jgi:hypothetical protein